MGFVMFELRNVLFRKIDFYESSREYQIKSYDMHLRRYECYVLSFHGKKPPSELVFDFSNLGTYPPLFPLGQHFIQEIHVTASTPDLEDA